MRKKNTMTHRKAFVFVLKRGQNLASDGYGWNLCLFSEI